MLDEMRIRTACFARAPQRCTSRLGKHFLLIFQEVTPLSKTRNQLRVANGLAVGPQSASLAERLLTSMCRPWQPMPTRPSRVPTLADDAGAQRRTHSTGPGNVVPPSPIRPKRGTKRKWLTPLKTSSTRSLVHLQTQCPMAPLGDRQTRRA
jgi:hypothetical protein